MMPGFFQRLIRLDYEYENTIEQQRAQRLLIIAVVFLIIAILWTFLVAIPTALSSGYDTFEIIIPFVGIAVGGILIQLIHRGHAQWAGWLFVIFAFLAGVPLRVEWVNTPSVVSIMVPVVAAAILLDQRALVIVTGLAILVLIRGAVFIDRAVALPVDDILGIILSIVLMSWFLGLFKQGIEQLSGTSSRLLVQAGRLGHSSLNMPTDATRQELVTHAINILRNQLGFSYIRVVFIDDNQQPIQTYYSSIGVEQIAETNTFAFTENSAFQQALDTLQPQIISPTDLANLSSHLLPASTSGVIIPASSLDQTIALFDIQTESRYRIEPETVSLLNIFISQVATQLAYQETVTTLKNDVQRQVSLIEQQRQQILRMQNLQTEGIVTEWENYLKLRGVDAIGYDIDNRRQLSDITLGNVPEELRPALESGEIVVRTMGNEQIVTVPIRLRDNILGAMAFTIPQEIPITERKVDFIRSVTERLALALDNKRLIEQTQTQAQRESTANEIGSILLSSTDVESVLQTAADRFNEALGAIATQIYLQPSALQPIDRTQREDTV